MSLDAWLNHYARQLGVVYDEDGVICDWRPTE